MNARQAFLAGDRADDIAIYLSESGLRNADALADRAEDVDGGYVLVLSGERGREVFSVVAGEPPMEFAQEASERHGDVDRDLTGGSCPEAAAADGVDGAGGDEGGNGAPSHEPRFLLAFVQEQTADAGGLYEEGDVVHAYVRCECGAAYTDRWLAGEETSG